MPPELLIVFLGLCVAAVGSYLAGRASIGSGGLWPAAWVVILTAVFIGRATPEGLSISVGSLMGTLFAGLILAGAIRFVGRRVPLWLLPGAAVLGGIRALLVINGHDLAAGAIALVPEPAAEIAAAVLVYRFSRDREAPLQQRLLAPALLVLAAVDLWTGILTIRGQDLRPLALAWLSCATVLSILQLTTFLHLLQARIRERTAQLARSNQELRDEIGVRVAAEGALRRSAERHARISSLNSDYSFVVQMNDDGTNQLIWASGAYERITGYSLEQMTELGWDAFVHPDDLEKVRHYFGSQPLGKTASLEYRIVCRDGQLRWVEQFSMLERDPSTGVRMLYGASHDVTERKHAEAERDRLEARMHEAQKLESLGVLAGGVAHDFNNLLTVILGNTAMVIGDLPEGSAQRERLDRVRKTAQYAADLTGQMLAYAGSTVMASKPVDLSRLVDDMLVLLAPELPANVTLDVDLGESLPIVEGDDSRLRQVVMNLVTNAGEAMSERGGRLRVRTGVMRVQAESLVDAVPNAEFPSDAAVYLEVSDEGCGIDEETRSRIFEPFFTTKGFAPGRKASGRGLGLAAVLGVVRGHRGCIQLETEADEGTTFRVLFPATQKAIEKRAPARAARADEAQPTLLLIDDDEMVREIACEFLTRAGYPVLVANSGQEGLERLAQHGDEIGLVLLDFVMPDMDGETVLARIRESHPLLPVVVVTGYPQEAERGADRLSLSGYLEKPYDPDRLVEVVEKALAS